MAQTVNLSNHSRVAVFLIAIALVTLGTSCNRPAKPGVLPGSGQVASVGTPSQVNPDQKSLEELRTAGSDLSKVHSIQFYLYVPSEQDAKAAAKTLQERDFNTVVKEGTRGKNWLCLGQKSMTPTMEHVTEVRELFESLAAQYHGKYDGWKAPVEP